MTRATRNYLHRYQRDGHQAPLPPGRHEMICDLYKCDRSPRIGESGTAYSDYAVQCGTLVKTSRETVSVA